MMANTHYDLIETPVIEIGGKTYHTQTYNMSLSEFLKTHHGNSLYILRSSLEEDKIRAIIMEENTKTQWEKITHVGSSLPARDGQYAMFVGRWQPLHEGHQSLFKAFQNIDISKLEHSASCAVHKSRKSRKNKEV